MQLMMLIGIAIERDLLIIIIVEIDNILEVSITFIQPSLENVSPMRLKVAIFTAIRIDILIAIV